jgi:hypothetical protein
MNPKDYSARELEANGMSCFIVKINPFLEVSVLRRLKSGFECSLKQDDEMDTKEILLDFFPGQINNDQLKVN